jgi:ankyrin repeat protein
MNMVLTLTENWETMEEAYYIGHEAIVEEILEHLGVDSEKLLALYQAITLKHKAIVQIFLHKLGKNYFMQERFSNGETPMHMAAATYGDEQMVKMLQDSGVLKDADGMTPLHCASEGGHTSLVETLLTEAKAKDDVNSRDGNGKTPLHLAIYAGHKEIVDMLLSVSDVDVNLKDNEGAYPLHWAAKLGYATIVEKILREKDGDVNCTDNTGMTPLHWIAKNTECNSSDLSDLAAVVEKILAAPNVDASKEDSNGISSLRMAILHDQYVIAEMILKALGKDFVNNYEVVEESILHLAAREGKGWVVKIILKMSGIHVNCEDIFQMTPLHLAAMEGQSEVVDVLLGARGVWMNCKDTFGMTPLHWAIYAGHKEIVDMLLSVSDIDVNLKDNEGAYPLHWAAKFGYVTIVGKILREKNGDVNCTDNTGMTPLHWVAKNTEYNNSDLSDHAAVVEKILAAPNVDASKEDNNEISPLRMAIMYDQYVIAEMILKALRKDFVNYEVVEESILQWAAREGKAWVVKVILKISGANVNCEDLLQMTPLHWAAMEGHSEVVDVLLGARGVWMNCKDTFGMTPLHWAAMEGHHAVVKTLCSRIQTMDVNSKDGEGKTPLHLAVEKGHEAVVEELLEYPEVDLFREDLENLPPLYWAIKLNHKAIVQMFLNKLGKNYFMKEQFSNGETPMHMATAMYGHEEMVKMPQDSGVLKDANGMTALHCASEGGQTSLVETLLKEAKAGADEKSKVEATATGIDYIYDDEEAKDSVNNQDENGKTPLHLAIYAGHKEIVDMLLNDLDIDVNLKDKEGAYPLHWAAKLGYATIVEKILKEKNGDVNCTDNTGMTPLHWVAKNTEFNRSDLSDHAAVVEKILAAPNVDATKRDNNRISPFIMAAIHDQNVLAEMILKALGNDVLNICEDHGESLLHWAATVGKIGVVNMIVKTSGVDMNLKDIYHMTPLHWAAKKGHRIIVSMFLKIGVSVNCKDTSGRTPLHWAASSGHHTVVKTLRSHITNDIVNDIDGDSKTPLHLAVEGGHEEVVKEIMKVPGVDLVNEVFYELCPLCRAIMLSNEAIVLIFLEALGLDYFAQKRVENGKPLMHLAAMLGHAAMVEKLSEAGLDASVTDADEMTPLHCASQRGHAAAVQTLLGIGTVYVNRKNMEGMTPLCFAVLSGDNATVRTIVTAKDVDVNCVDKHGKTPLHWAVDKRTPEIVRILLQETDIRLVEDRNDKTALEYAFELSPESSPNIRTIVGYLSESPIGKAFVDTCFRDRQVYVDASNAILVGAALIAGVTFASWLQPPLGYSTYYEETLTNPYPGPPTSYPNYVDFEHHKALQAFWIFNSLSFFFSTSTMVMGARSVLPMQNVFLKQAVRKICSNLLITASLLFFSILFGTISFSIAGYIVIPPKIKFQANILSTIAVGGSICLSSLYLLGRSLAGELKPWIMKFKVDFFKR